MIYRRVLIHFKLKDQPQCSFMFASGLGRWVDVTSAALLMANCTWMQFRGSRPL